MNNNSNEFTNYSLYNNATGEIVQDLKITELKALRNATNTIRVNDSKASKNDSEIAAYMNEILGSFNHLYYKKLIDKEYIFRFIYLCTYINYKNYVELGQAKEESKLATKKDLFEIFKNLSTKEVYRTINYFTENELIIEDEKGYIKINDKTINKGKLKNKRNVTRIFNNTIQELYNKATIKEHKKLGLFIKMLPYINFHYNIVCTNIEEDNKDLINKISLTQLAKLMGYSRTQRLTDDLFDLKINGEYVIMIAKIAKKDMIVVNPKVYYKGNNIKNLAGVITLFDIGSNNK